MNPDTLPPELHAHLWPLHRLGEGLQALAALAGLQGQAAQALVLPPELARSVEAGSEAADDLGRWLEWAATPMGLQTESVQCTVPEVPLMLRQAAPALLLLNSPQGPHFVLLTGRRAGALVLLDPDLRRRRCAPGLLRDVLCAPLEAPLQSGVNRLLADAQVPAARLERARRALLAERLAATPVQGAWLLRRPASSGVRALLAQARVPQRVAGMLALLAVLYTLEIAGWRLIGQAALDGRLDMGWLSAWVLLLLTLVPLRLLSSALNTGIALDTGLALRQRLLAGALRMDLDVLRRQGSGQLLARVIESQALESAGLAGALGLGISLLELGFAGWVLAQGAAPGLHVALLLAWVLGLGLLAWRQHGHLRAWTDERLEMTHRLVERMVGHRTRLAQEHPARRAAEEDHELGSYLRHSQALDRSLLPVVSLAPGGWLLLALLALAPALATVGDWRGSAQGLATGPALLAISLGGILFAHRALGGLSGGLGALARARVAWQQAAPLFKAGASAAQPGAWVTATPAASQATPTTATPLVDAHALNYGYRPGAAPVLKGASLQLGAHDRVLLAGPSGSGKSTLAALLVGLRRPASGLLLMGGLDRATLGDQWHRWATEAPQFHNNHIFTGTLAFNLLIGREWPARAATLAEAQTLCEELGLGPLLQRMPGGLQQRVGESGWQLSHGERSRVFLARALLQRAPLTVLDESFAALDPATLHRCLNSALQRAQALVVIAHP
jgi:ATP-binding cassette, subfamily B, bacterial